MVDRCPAGGKGIRLRFKEHANILGDNPEKNCMAVEIFGFTNKIKKFKDGKVVISIPELPGCIVEEYPYICENGTSVYGNQSKIESLVFTIIASKLFKGKWDCSFEDPKYNYYYLCENGKVEFEKEEKKIKKGNK